MFKWSVFFLYVLFVFNGFSQNSFKEKITIADKIYYAFPDSSYKIYLSIDKSTLKEDEIASLSLGKAKCLLLLTDYINCEKELLNAELIYRKKGNKSDLAATLSLKSILSRRLGEYDESRRLLLEAYAINVELGDSSAIAGDLTNLTVDYLEINQNDSAKICLKKLDDLKAIIREDQFYFVNQNWGRYYHNVGNNKMALTYYYKALKVAEKHGMVDSKATILMLIGQSYYQVNDEKNAEKYANMSYAYSATNNLILEKSEALEVMLKIAEKRGDFKRAFSLQKEYAEVKDSILNIDKLTKVKQVKTKLEIAEKEKEIASSKAKAVQSELEMETTQSQNNLLLLSLLALCLILLTLAYAFVKNKKLYGIISLQKKEVEHKNNLISEALKDIDDSLTYSKFIQSALLPPDQDFLYFNDFFILFKPKEKVSGDFYWLHKTEDFVYFCVADCTGHGVPGALVSVVGANALNSCLNEFKLTEPREILDKMSALVEETLFSQDRNMKDGMDLAFCRLNLKTKELTFSGANNPIYILNSSVLDILSPNKQPIGRFEYRKPFTQETRILKEGDCLYLFTDGFADQFGGPKGKKFMYKKLRDLLVQVAELPMGEQNEILKKEFEKWRGSNDQVDDVCLVGVKV